MSEKIITEEARVDIVALRTQAQTLSNDAADVTRWHDLPDDLKNALDELEVACDEVIEKIKGLRKDDE